MKLPVNASRHPARRTFLPFKKFVFCLKAILDLTEDNLQAFYVERPKVNFLVMSALLVLVVAFL